MKLRLTVILFLLVAFASTSLAQTIAIQPDSGTAGATVQVTIVGSGTQFKPSHTISGFTYTTVSLKRSGQTYYSTNPSILNDSLIDATFMLPASMASGLYDLAIVRTQDTPTINYSLSNAFYVRPAPAKITAVSKSYGYSGQTMHISITGFNTSFSGLPGQIAINFKQNGSVIFQTHADSIQSVTQLAATVTIPANASGTFDIQVQNPGFNYSGTQLFSVYADPGQQSITVSPDSGAAASSIPVTIVGSGTHFTASGVVSGFSTEISLQRSGQSYYYTSPSQIVNDSLIRATFSPSVNMQSGWYDVTVRQTQPPYYTVTGSNAFYIKPATPKLIAVTPISAYQGQTVKMLLYGQNTLFGGQPGQITIDFKQSGTTQFSVVADSVAGSTRLLANVAVPASAPAGVYDIDVTDSGRVYSGAKLFTVLSGPPPNIHIVRDTGISGDTMSVTIVGQNTNFNPSQGVSVVNTITLTSGGQTYLQTKPTSVSSTTSMAATFDLSQVPAGIYDVELRCAQYYDYLTTYTVIPHVSIAPAQPRPDTVRSGGTISIGVVGHGTHFVGVQSTMAFLFNPKIGPSSIIAANSVAVTNDTMLTATFAVPSASAAGAYDLTVVEPSGTQETMKGALVVQSSSGVSGPNTTAGISDLVVSPNPSREAVSVAFVLGTPEHIQLTVCDALGHSRGVLCDRLLEAGAHRFDWSANVPNGTYIYELLAGTERRTGSIVVAK
jgi:hypothetical protein